MKNLLMESADALEASVSEQKVLVGLDGFVDQIVHVVDERASHTSYKRVKKISDFARTIDLAAGLSANVELVIQTRKLGGNGPILGNALHALGNEIDFIGAIGKHEVDDVFKEFAGNCQRVVSLADPGTTDAMEFHDGKLMFGKMESLRDVNWEQLVANVSIEELIEMANQSGLIALTNWTELPHFESILRGLYRHVLPKLTDRPKVFIDLADPSKRKFSDIAKLAKLLRSVGDVADLILGMNENESSIISVIHSIDCEDLRGRAGLIRKKLNMHAAIIHGVKGAVAACRESTTEWIEGPYCETPKLSTGAGDHFNAGFCNAYLRGLSLAKAVTAGVFTSGYYVRDGQTPSQQELVRFMREWK